MGSTPTRVTARWGRLWPAAALSVGLRCPRRAIAGQDPEHTTRRWSVMATRLPAKQHQAGSIPVDVSRDESHNHVPWSNGTTPVRHTGNDGSIPSGTIRPRAAFWPAAALSVGLPRLTRASLTQATPQMGSPAGWHCLLHRRLRGSTPRGSTRSATIKPTQSHNQTNGG